MHILKKYMNYHLKCSVYSLQYPVRRLPYILKIKGACLSWPDVFLLQGTKKREINQNMLL